MVNFERRRPSCNAVINVPTIPGLLILVLAQIRNPFQLTFTVGIWNFALRSHLYNSRQPSVLAAGSKPIGSSQSRRGDTHWSSMRHHNHGNSPGLRTSSQLDLAKTLSRSASSCRHPLAGQSRDPPHKLSLPSLRSSAGHRRTATLLWCPSLERSRCACFDRHEDGRCSLQNLMTREEKYEKEKFQMRKFQTKITFS